MSPFSQYYFLLYMYLGVCFFRQRWHQHGVLTALKIMLFSKVQIWFEKWPGSRIDLFCLLTSHLFNKRKPRLLSIWLQKLKTVFQYSVPLFLECSCEEGWAEYFGNCYRFHNDTDALRWKDAERLCKEEGALLTSIADYAEMNFLHFMLTSDWFTQERATYIGW